MPIDPYFTSAVPARSKEREARVARAKAFQAKRLIRFLAKEKKSRAIESIARTFTESQLLSIRHGGRLFAQSNSGPGARSIVGFKAPRKKWDEKKQADEKEIPPQKEP